MKSSHRYESIFDNTNIPSVYDKSRRLSEETLFMWMDKINNEISIANKDKTIIDLGCGTGRFTGILAKYFKGNVLGIDPSAKMLSYAKQSFPEIQFLIGNSEGIPVNNEFADMIFLSQVYHHLTNLKNFVKELQRVLKPNKFVCIRNSTIDNMESYVYPRFFPSALAIDLKRLPERNKVVELFEMNNFRSIFTEPVKQVFAYNHINYYEKVSLRGCSDLAAIEDSEFIDGLKNLKIYCEGIKSDQPIFEEIDLFIFEKL